MLLPPNVTPIYIRKRGVHIDSFRPGKLIDVVYGEPYEVLKLLRYVPDQNHQSSLDYLKGV
jgi:hypothetical protein